MPVLGGFMVPHPPIILPEVGRGEEAKIESTMRAYMEVAEKVAEIRPDTLLIASPHMELYADYFHVAPCSPETGSMQRFRAPQVSFREEYDRELTDKVAELAQQRDFPAGKLGARSEELDHGTMIPLYFIRKRYTDFRIIRIGLSGLSLEEHYRMGMLLRDAVNELGRNAVFIASGDLSHKLKEDGPYGFDPAGPVYDEKIMEVMGGGRFGELMDFEENLLNNAAECGHRSFVMMAGCMDGMTVEAKALSHEGPFGVGYGIVSVIPKAQSSERCFLKIREEEQRKLRQSRKENEDPYVKLARSTVESFVKEGRKAGIPEDLPVEMLTDRAGVFVTLHEEGRLRGCIGTISPSRENIAEEIRSNAVSACSRDPRFQPVRPAELDRLEYSVDVLEEPEEIDGPEQLDVKEYGVIVSSGHRRGLLLPNLEGVDTVEDQIRIARQKAGIAPTERADLQRFKVTRHF